MTLSHPLMPRGACPTLEAPMPVADGLLARFRPVAGLTPDQIAALSEAAERHGNGLIEVTARGSLQVRGLSTSSAPGFRAALSAAGIFAQPAPQIEMSPIAGLDPKETADPHPLAEALALVRDRALQDGPLSPKLSIVLVTGGQVPLDGLKGDIRLIATGRKWGLEVEGTVLGALDETDVPTAMATVFRALQAKGERTRARDLDLHRLESNMPTLSPLSPIPESEGMVGPLTLTAGRTGLRIGLSFGQMTAAQMEELARLMEAHGAREARGAPDRTLVLLGSADAEMAGLAGALDALGFQNEARLTICSGAERSAGGIIQAAELARALCSVDPELADGSFHLHVSTCAKGCAHAGRPGIVLNGDQLTLYRAPHAKPLASLDPAAIETGIVSLARRIRDSRQPGETTLTVLGRLGQQ